VEILEAMDESFVAKKLTELMSQNLKEAKEATWSHQNNSIPFTHPKTDSFQDQNPEFDFSDYRFEVLSSIFDDLSSLTGGALPLERPGTSYDAGHPHI
jgi:hypothetical protein